jgi:hypothetical protein
MLLNTCLSSMTNMLLFLPKYIVFVCKSHYIDCLIKELGIDNSLGNLTYTRRHLRKRKSWTIVGLFYVPLEFQLKMKNWIYLHSTGFLKYTSVLSKSAILPNDTSYTRGGVNQMWILTNSKDLLEYIQSRSLSSCNSIKTFDFSTLYTTIPHSKLKDRLRELVQLCLHKKEWLTNTSC